MPRFTVQRVVLLFIVAITILIVALVSNSAGMAPRKRPSSGRPWSDGPLPLVKTPSFKLKKTDTWTLGASHMALLHNSILRGYNSIYLQAPHVQPDDYVDFIGYSLTWYKFIKTHHDAEEEDLFPQCLEVLGKEDREIWTKTHEEHEAMLPPLARFNDYLTGLSNPSHFDAKTLLLLMDDIKESLLYHLHSEPVIIAALSKYGNFPAAEPALDAWGRRSVIGAGWFDVVPFMFLNHDRTYEDGQWQNWPPIPNLARTILVKSSKVWNRGWWRFASCDGDGMPKDLYIADAVVGEADRLEVK